MFICLCLLLCQSCIDDTECARNNRTVIIFMEANNNLASDARANLDDLLEKANNKSLMENGRLLVFLNSYNGSQRLYEVKAPSKNNKHSDTTLIKSYDYITPLSKGPFHQIVSDAIKAADAKEYVLLLWSHSTGWFPKSISITEESRQAFAPGIDKVAAANDEEEWPLGTKGFGRDGNYQISYRDIGLALEGLGINLVMIDACFGAGIETLYDLRHSCDYVLASPIEIIAFGYPYLEIMDYLFNKNLSIGGLAKAVGLTYMDFYRNLTYGGKAYPYAAISLVDMSQIDSLASISRQILTKYKDVSIDHSQIQGLENRRQSIFFDFHDYMQHVCAADSQDIFTTFAEQFERCVVYHDHTDYLYSNLSGRSIRALEHCEGLSCYIPWPDNTSDYFELCNEAYYQTDWARYIYKD